jgi:hypothetical protein
LKREREKRHERENLLGGCKRLFRILPFWREKERQRRERREKPERERGERREKTLKMRER